MARGPLTWTDRVGRPVVDRPVSVCAPARVSAWRGPAGASGGYHGSPGRAGRRESCRTDSCCEAALVGRNDSCGMDLVLPASARRIERAHLRPGLVRRAGWQFWLFMRQAKLELWAAVCCCASHRMCDPWLKNPARRDQGSGFPLLTDRPWQAATGAPIGLPRVLPDPGCSARRQMTFPGRVRGRVRAGSGDGRAACSHRVHGRGTVSRQDRPICPGHADAFLLV